MDLLGQLWRREGGGRMVIICKTSAHIRIPIHHSINTVPTRTSQYHTACDWLVNDRSHESIGSSVSPFQQIQASARNNLEYDFQKRVEISSKRIEVDKASNAALQIQASNESGKGETELKQVLVIQSINRLKSTVYFTNNLYQNPMHQTYKKANT